MKRISKYTAISWVHRITGYEKRIRETEDPDLRAEAARQRQALIDALHAHNWGHLLP